MANKDIVNGAMPYGPLLRIRPYQAEGTVYPGDLLKFHADGTVEQAAAAGAAMGVALTYAVADGTVLVADHPDQEFVMQADDDTINAQADIGLNYDIIVAAANTTYRRSGMEIDASTQATTATLPIKVLRILPAVDNALGANVKCICKINNHQLGSHTGTAGV
jgi:hypothetical protein